MLPAATTPVKTAKVIGELLHSKRPIKKRQLSTVNPVLSPLSFILGNSNVAPGNSN